MKKEKDFNKNKSFTNKIFIVTGASDGSGREISLQIGAKGGTVVLAARRESILEDVAALIRKSGGEALVVKTDLRDNKQIKNLVKKTLDTFGRIDGLVNVAGMGYYDWIEETTLDEISEQYEVNVIAMVKLISEVVPTMKKQKSGHIVNFASYASRVAIPPLTIYSSTKYAVEGLSDALYHELAPWGIHVTRIHPSAVDTKFNEKAKRHGGIDYPFDTLTGVKKEHVAKLVVNALEKPRKAVFIARFKPLLDSTVLINRHLPLIMDLIMSIRVKKLWKDDKKHDLQVHL